jgi:hypothetical protein
MPDLERRATGDGIDAIQGTGSRLLLFVDPSLPVTIFSTFFFFLFPSRPTRKHHLSYYRTTVSSHCKPLYLRAGTCRSPSTCYHSSTRATVTCASCHPRGGAFIMSRVEANRAVAGFVSNQARKVRVRTMHCISPCTYTNDTLPISMPAHSFSPTWPRQLLRAL